MNVAARRAVPDDLPRLAELALAAVDEAAGMRGGARLIAEAAPEDPARALAGALDSDDHSLWAGTIDDVVMGVAVADAAGRPVGRVPLVYVEPDARSVGVGEVLLERALGWLASSGCEVADAVALPGSRAAKQFFEAHGMVARLIVMSRPLP